MRDHTAYGLTDLRLPGIGLLPAGVTGIDAGLTMTKVARGEAGGIVLTARDTSSATAGLSGLSGGSATGITGAAATRVETGGPVSQSQEIEAAARGVRALSALAGGSDETPFLLTLLGTGTAFAAVRGDAVQHLGGAALGGGSFAGIARRIDPTLTYESMLAAAHRGDRRKVDVMVGDAYPEGIGRIGGEMTAAHLAANDNDETVVDVLAALLNLHGESIAQIAASRARIAAIGRIVLAGGFAHNNDALVSSITQMCTLFGITVAASPHPGFVGAIGAGLVAAEATQKESAI